MQVRLAFVLVWLGLLAPQAWAEPHIDIPATVTPDLRAALLMSLNLPALTADAAAMAREEGRLTELVRDLGYLDGSVDITRGQGSETFDLDVEAGPLYRIGSIQVIGLDGVAPAPLQAGIHDLIATTVGMPARADIVSQLASDMVWRARSAAFAMAAAEIADLATDPSETAALTIRLTLGAPHRIGRSDLR
jgi:outer membrane protein assembly factor BamA